MQIHQTQVRYLPEEDRILFSVLTTEHQELLFLLTRRFVLLVLPVFFERLQMSLNVTMQPSNAGKQAMLRLEQEWALSKSNFTQSYSEDIRERPLGDEPLLLHSMKMKSLKRGYLLSLHDKQGKGIEMTVDEKLIHALVKLIRNAAMNADWRIAQSTQSARPSKAIEALH